jgi:hypothetical protein
MDSFRIKSVLAWSFLLVILGTGVFAWYYEHEMHKPLQALDESSETARTGGVSCRAVHPQPAAQAVAHPIFVSHDIFSDFTGSVTVADLRVVADGTVVFRVGTINPQRTVLDCAVQIESDEMQRLLTLLDTQGVRSLPKKVFLYQARLQDSSWERMLEINRSDRTQEIRVALSPSTKWPPVAKPDPEAITQLDCKVRQIRAKVIKDPVFREGRIGPRCNDLLSEHPL